MELKFHLDREGGGMTECKARYWGLLLGVTPPHFGLPEPLLWAAYRVTHQNDGTSSTVKNGDAEAWVLVEKRIPAWTLALVRGRWSKGPYTCVLHSNVGKM